MEETCPKNNTHQAVVSRIGQSGFHLECKRCKVNLRFDIFGVPNDNWPTWVKNTELRTRKREPIKRPPLNGHHH